MPLPNKQPWRGPKNLGSISLKVESSEETVRKEVEKKEEENEENREAQKKLLVDEAQRTSL